MKSRYDFMDESEVIDKETGESYPDPLSEALQEGEMQGIAKGKEEGKAEGIAEEKSKIAKKMLAQGIAIEIIATPIMNTFTKNLKQGTNNQVVNNVSININLLSKYT